MSWAEIKKAVNSDIDVPLNTLIENSKSELDTLIANKTALLQQKLSWRFYSVYKLNQGSNLIVSPYQTCIALIYHKLGSNGSMSAYRGASSTTGTLLWSMEASGTGYSFDILLLDPTTAYYFAHSGSSTTTVAAYIVVYKVGDSAYP